MFVEAIKMTLTLEIGSDLFTVVGGDIKSCDLELHSYGFDASVTFWVSLERGRVDTILPRFITPDLISARLSVERVGSTPAQAPIVVKGIVTDKELAEGTFDDTKRQPVLVRTYTIHFKDAARVLWKQHFPITLLADASLSDALKAQVPVGITIAISNDSMTKEQAVLCLGLGDDTSLYDFVLWFLDSVGGQFFLDYTSNTYQLAGEKGALGTAAWLTVEDVEKVQLRFPEVPRRATRILNTHSETSKSIPVPHTQAVASLYRDELVCTSIVMDLAVRTLVEASRLQWPKPEVEVEYKRMTDLPYMPGARVGLQKEYFSAALQATGQSYRVGSMWLKAEASDPSPDHARGTPSTRYRTNLRARWESEDDKVCRTPPFQYPRYPVLAQGKIIAAGGKAGDRSYSTFDDSGASFYKVQVPLWNQKIPVPFQPQFTPGHFYAPAFKDSRVLLALYFDRAEILQFLDWGTDVQLPNDTQGNHLLFGKNATSQTSMKHAYVDEKPVFSISRICTGDMEMITLDEGSLVLQTKVDVALAAAVPVFDLLGEVAAANDTISAGTKAAIGKVASSFGKSKGQVVAKAEEAKAATKAALDGMDDAVSAQAEAAAAEIDGAMGALAGKAEALKGQAGAAVAELKSKLEL